MSGEERLREVLRRLALERTGAGRPPEEEPGCTYGLLIRETLDDLRGDLDDVKKELEWIRRVIVVAIVSAGIGTLLQLAGWTQ
jgi:tRNA(Ser,Leu) C12 N-acetylase TAN1